MTEKRKECSKKLKRKRKEKNGKKDGIRKRKRRNNELRMSRAPSRQVLRVSEAVSNNDERGEVINAGSALKRANLL